MPEVPTKKKNSVAARQGWKNQGVLESDSQKTFGDPDVGRKLLRYDEKFGLKLCKFRHFSANFDKNLANLGL